MRPAKSTTDKGHRFLKIYSKLNEFIAAPEQENKGSPDV